ncbi:MAG: hypothetical protein KDA58_11910 [Planctomycetaceae bacterium]|nr:hypothetical protein [Planctomycetaceae bacterium]
MNVLRACIRWYRLVLPVPGLTLGFLVFFGLSEALSMVVFHWSIPPGEIFAPENPLGGGVCVLAAMVYAGFRVFYFHPLWQPRYRRWLLSTPWTVIDPLPGGPVQLALQDLIPLTLLSLGASRLEGHHWYVVPGMFAAIWMLASLVTFACVGPRWLAYVLVFLAGGIARTALTEPTIAISIAGIMIAATQWGHHLSLSKFHDWAPEWNEKPGFDDVLTSNTEAIAEHQMQSLLGWPFEQMAPDLKKYQTLLKPWTGFLLALLVAWEYDCIIHLMAAIERRPIGFLGLGTFVGGIGVGLSSLRLFGFLNGHAPPLTLMGRIKTGRLIIPGYDYVFIAPALVLLVSTIGVGLAHFIPLPPILKASGLLMTIVFLVSTTPPDLAEFHYTGNHRITPDMKQRTSNFLIKD